MNRSFWTWQSMKWLVVAIVFAAVFSGLGVWQLDRMRQKQATQTAYELANQSPVMPWRSSTQTWSRFQKLSVTGQQQARWLLANRTHAGQPGYDVIGGVCCVDQALVWVNHGFIPWRPITADFTDVLHVANEASMTYHGQWVPLPQPGWVMGATESAFVPPGIGSFPTDGETAEFIGQTTLPGMLLLSAESNLTYKTAWQDRYAVSELGPERHLGYAVQWFAMALATLLLWGWLARRHRHLLRGIDA